MGQENINHKNYLWGFVLKKALDAISPEEWLKIILVVKNIAERLVKKTGFYQMPAEELVNEAIVRIYEKTRNEKKGRSWDGESTTSLCKVLIYTIRSIMAQERARESKKAKIYTRFFEDNPINSYGANKIDYSLLRRTILERVQDDSVLVIIVKNIFDDPSLKRGDIKEFIGYNEERINNAYKRFKRKTKDLKPLFNTNQSVYEREKKDSCNSFYLEQTGQKD
jgi:hypothetical protein